MTKTAFDQYKNVKYPYKNDSLMAYFQNNIGLQIIDFFLDYPNSEFTKKELAKESNISLRYLDRYLPLLTLHAPYKAIISRTTSLGGRQNNVHLYSLNKEHYSVQLLLKFKQSLTV